MNQLEVDLILKRSVPFTGTMQIRLSAQDSLTSLYGTPVNVNLGSWAYDGPTADFTLGTAFNWLGTLDPYSFQMTVTPQVGPPGTVTLSASEPGTTINPNAVNFSTMTPQTVTVVLPYRPASYPLVITAKQVSNNKTKTQTVNVNVVKWDYDITMSPDQTVIAGGTARFSISITPINGFYSPVSLTNLSGFGTLSQSTLLPGQVATFTASGGDIGAVNTYEVRIQGENQGTHQVVRRITVQPQPQLFCQFFNTSPTTIPLKLKRAQRFDGTCTSTGYTGDVNIAMQQPSLDLTWAPAVTSLRSGVPRPIRVDATLQYWGTSSSTALLNLAVQGPSGVAGGGLGQFTVYQETAAIPRFEVAPPSPLLMVPAGSQLVVPVRITRAEISPGVPYQGSVAFCGGATFGAAACPTPASSPIAPFVILNGPTQSAGSIILKTSPGDKGVKTYNVNWAEMTAGQPLSGQLQYTVWVQDAPAQPLLSVAGNPPTATVVQGRSVDFNLKIDYQNLRGPVRLQLGNGWPAGTTIDWPDANGVSLPADKLTQTLTMTVRVPSNAATGIYLGDLRCTSDGVATVTTLTLTVTDASGGGPKFTVTSPGYQFLSAAGQPWSTRMALSGKVKLRIVDPSANSGYPVCQVDSGYDRGTAMQCSRPYLSYGQDAESEVTVARVPLELINQTLDFRLTYALYGEPVSTNLRVEFRLEGALPKNPEDSSALSGLPITEFIRMGGRVVVMEKK